MQGMVVARLCSLQRFALAHLERSGPRETRSNYQNAILWIVFDRCSAPASLSIGPAFTSPPKGKIPHRSPPVQGQGIDVTCEYKSIRRLAALCRFLYADIWEETGRRFDVNNANQRRGQCLLPLAVYGDWSAIVGLESTADSIIAWLFAVSWVLR